ncbi:hyaluronan and proteoglycan link protein 1-like [Clinocottus analis]|uniref:hyaluronan and proteoglycan link protein 1-like n=1 Tax=Clinocottus analis TaxID=304258 RepID=UPI0035C1CC8A
MWKTEKMTSLLCITIISLTLAGSAYSQPMSHPLKPTVMVMAGLGANVTLPCQLPSKDAMTFGNIGVRVKWTKVAEDEALNEDVLLSMGFHKKTYGSFAERAFLNEFDNEDASLTITDVSAADSGKYRCEIINGMEDVMEEVVLDVLGGLTEGVVFPYSTSKGRYNLNFDNATQACLGQNASVATLEQLHEAWKGGLDWCNAGWLSDGTVYYPVTKARGPCGGNKGPGLISYGSRDKQHGRFDVFCFASALNGHFYWLVQPDRLTFDEAVQACVDDGAEIAKVGHMYSAWKLEGYDRCDAGWLADGSVRYPISRPRKNCSPTEAAVRFIGFPDKMQKSYGVYCYKAE